ncbi:hypothetical protein FMN50_01185 [Rhodobacterales bacterium]|nr:hypothetical protein FMN50_01185 [Rhodobacterales bacterium]
MPLIFTLPVSFSEGARAACAVTMLAGRGLVLLVAMMAVVIIGTPCAEAGPRSRFIDLPDMHARNGLVSIRDHMSFLRDDSGKLTAEDVILGTHDQAFVPVEPNLALGYTSDTVWIKVTLLYNKTDAGDLGLILLPVYVDDLQVFVPKVAQPRSRDDFEIIIRGDHHLDEQAGAANLFYWSRLDLPDASQATLYFRLQSTSSVNLRAMIATPAGMMYYAIFRTATVSGLLIISLLAIALSLLFWTQSKRRYFLSFALLMFSNAYVVGCGGGLLIVNSFNTGGQFNDIVTGMQTLLATFANIMFVRDYVQTKLNFPRLHRVFNIVLVLNALAFVTLFTERIPYFLVASPLYVATLLALLLLCGRNSVLFRRHRDLGRLTAFLASAIYAGFALLNVLVMVGGTDIIGLQEINYWIPMVPFTLLMLLSMIIRGRRLEEYKKATSALRQSRRAEHRALVMVNERTRELLGAKHTAEAALQAERQMQSEQLRFIDIVRHQYQTPLAVIRSCAATLTRTLPKRDTANLQRIGRIEAATADLVDVLQTSLERSRMQETTTVAKRSEVLVQEHFRKVVARAQSMHDSHCCHLDFHHIDQQDRAFFDEGMVAIALANLLDNAVKFSPDASDIQIDVTRQGQSLTVAVKDGGIGTPETERQMLTHRYARGSNAGNVSGSGLGLNIVAGLVKAHEGEFTLDSIEPQGTKAQFTLPHCFVR